MSIKSAELKSIFTTGIDNGDNILSTLEENIGDFYLCLYEQINCLYDDIFRDEVYGKKTDRIDILASLNYLLFYLILIFQERELDSNNEGDKGSNYYRDLYKIEIVRDYFYCKGIDIDNVLNLFNLSYTNELVAQDGINFMEIDGDGITYPVFRIS